MTKVTYRLHMAPRDEPSKKRFMTTGIVRRAPVVISLLGLFPAACLGFGSAPGTVHLLDERLKEGRGAREQHDGVG